jgi:molybdenum cofactor biosynthesis protein B
VRCVVVTVSDSRTIATDTGGAAAVQALQDAGHSVLERLILPDEPRQIDERLAALAKRPDVDAILLTGGTGVSRRDRTCETVTARLDRILPGYGELFRMLSYQEIGPAAMLSRAVGGVMGEKIVLTMPGSQAAVRLAMDRLIVPELPHLVREATR